MSPENSWLESMYVLLKGCFFLRGIRWFSGGCKALWNPEFSDLRKELLTFFRKSNRPAFFLEVGLRVSPFVQGFGFIYHPGGSTTLELVVDLQGFIFLNKGQVKLTPSFRAWYISSWWHHAVIAMVWFTTRNSPFFTADELKSKSPWK